MDVFEKCSHTHPTKALIGESFDAYFRVLESPPDAEVVTGGRRMIMLGSNNYLGLANDPRVKRAAIAAIEKYGTGTTGSRLLNGTLDLHADLEVRIARFMRRDAAIFFTSGYTVNVGVIAGLVHQGECVVLDRNVHASIWDGALVSGATIKRFRHNDPRHLDRVLESCGDAGALVAVDGVYSMEGDLAPLPRIAEVCRAHGARLLVDDAHATGILGREGRGTGEHFGIENQIDLVVGTCSKALPAVGGFVVGNAEVIDYLRCSHSNRAFQFAASPPPAAVAAVREALAIIQERPQLRERLWSNTRRFLLATRAMGFDVGNTQTPIIPIRTGSMERAFAMWRMLTEDGIFVNVVVPPAVPSSSSILRVALTAALSDENIDYVLDAIERAGRKIGLIGEPPPVVREEHGPAPEEEHVGIRAAG
jgi:8-amino-7-oxononanoate synthase